MKQLTEDELKNWRRFHIPGCSRIHTIKIDAIFISTANSLTHELKKSEICYNIKKEGHHFITEAATGDQRHDVVDITNAEIYEIETTEARARRHPKNINVIMVKP